MKWYRCPFCGQKLLQYEEDTAQAEGLKIKCKGRGCGHVVEIKIVKDKNLKVKNF